MCLNFSFVRSIISYEIVKVCEEFASILLREIAVEKATNGSKSIYPIKLFYFSKKIKINKALWLAQTYDLQRIVDKESERVKKADILFKIRRDNNFLREPP